MIDLGPSVAELGTSTTKPTEIKPPPSPEVMVESRISADAKESGGMKILTEIYPESQLVQARYKYGWGEDIPNNGFDPATKEITITLDVGHVENEMKYMARSNPDALLCRAAIKTVLEKLCAGDEIPTSMRQQLLEIATGLASDPNAIEFGTEEFDSLSFLGFRQVQELVDANVADRVQRQKIYRAIYGKALAESQFAVTTMENKEGTTRVGTTNIEVHEKTHFVNDRNFPTHLPDTAELERVGKIRSQFFTDEPLAVQYDLVTDQAEKELTNAELVQINHKMMDMVASVVSDDPQVKAEYQKDAIRNARDEVVAITIETMAGEKPPHLRTVAIVKYATSGCHYFDRDPNLDIAELKSKIADLDTPEGKRQVIVDYLQNGFTDFSKKME